VFGIRFLRQKTKVTRQKWNLKIKDKGRAGRLPITLIILRITGRLPITDYRLPITLIILRITGQADYLLLITDYPDYPSDNRAGRLPITDYRLPITDYRLPITDY
jgi:hypothetical protein